MPSSIYQVRAQAPDRNHPQSFFCPNLKDAARMRKHLKRSGYKIIDTIPHSRPKRKVDILRLLNSIS